MSPVPPDPRAAGAPKGAAVSDVAALNESLKTIATLNERTVQLLEAQIRASERLNRVSKDTGKELDGWHTEMRTLLKDSARLEHSMKRIRQLQNSRVGAGSTKSGTAEYIRNLKQEYAILLRTLNTGQHSGKYIGQVNKLLGQLDGALKKVERTSDRTWDSSTDGLKEVNSLLAAAGQNAVKLQKAMDRIHVDKMTTGFRKMGAATNDAFDGQLGRMLRRIPGVQGHMDMRRMGRQAGAAKSNLDELRQQRLAQQQGAYRGNAISTVRRFGPKAITPLRAMGYTGDIASRTGRRHAATPQLRAATASGGNVSARAGHALDQMTVKSLNVETAIIKRSTGKGSGGNMSAAERREATRAAKRAGASTPSDTTPEVGTPGESTTPGAAFRARLARKVKGGPEVSPEIIQEALGGGGLGGAFNKWVGGKAAGGGMMGKMAQGLLSKGAGSAAAGLGQSVVGAGSGALSMGMGLVSKAAPAIAIAKGIMDIHDKVADENKRLQDALGAGGVRGQGTGAHDDFRAVRSTLLSTGLGNAARMGQGLPENMEIMKTITEGGMAPGRDLRSGKLNLGKSLTEQGTASGSGFYGTVMKNAVYNGKNLGMGQDSSVRLTMKLMEKFGKTTEATATFFLKMDTMMESSGVSASKYIDIIDNVTDEFDSMNKSLTGTLSVLNNLGKSGRLTGKTLEDVVKGLQAKTQMSTAQRIVNAQGMVGSGANIAAAQAEEANTARDMAELKASLDKYGVKGTEDILGNRNSIAVQLQNKGLPDADLKAITSSMDATIERTIASRGRSAALRSGDATRIASAVELSGESGTTAMYSKIQNMRDVAKSAGLSPGVVDRLLKGDPAALAELTAAKGSTAVSQMVQQGTFSSGTNFVDTANKLRTFTQSGALAAQQIGQKNETVDQMMADPTGKGRDRYNTMLALQKARVAKGLAKAPQGKTGAEADKAMVQSFQADARGPEAGKLVDQLQGLSTTLDMMSDSNSSLSKALEDMTTQNAAEAKAKSTTDATRPMADVFAKSFEYLFDRIINMLDIVTRYIDLGQWFEDHNKVNRDDYQAQVKGIEGMTAQVDQDKLNPAQKAAFDQIVENGRSGKYKDAETGPALLQADQRALANMLDRNPRFTKVTKALGEKPVAAGTVDLVQAGSVDALQRQQESQIQSDLAFGTGPGGASPATQPAVIPTGLGLNNKRTRAAAAAAAANHTTNNFISTPVFVNPTTRGQQGNMPAAPTVQSLK